MSKTQIYLALLLNSDYYDRGINDTIHLFQQVIPNNSIIIEKYITNGNINITNLALNDFINKYPTGNRITVSNQTEVLVQCSEFFINNNLLIPSISIGSSAELIKRLINVITYIPYSKYTVMSLFLIFKDYHMSQIKILYEKNSTESDYIQDFINEFNIQSDFLGVNIEFEALQQGIYDYKIKPNTNIILLSTTNSLVNNYINSQFLNSIPNSCYITLTQINEDIGDIFGSIPSFVILPYPLFYSETTQLVYNNLINKTNYVIGIYPLYDILYTLDNISDTDLSLTIPNYIIQNPFSGVLSAWGYTGQNIDIKINGIDFGIYSCIFTKDVLINDDLTIFLATNLGGLYNLKDSYSQFRVVGTASFYASGIYYDENQYNKMYDENGTLIMTKFSAGVSSFPSNDSKLFCNYGQYVDSKFKYQYNNSGYFNYLEITSNIFGPKQIVNSTMSKFPIIQYVK